MTFSNKLSLLLVSFDHQQASSVSFLFWFFLFPVGLDSLLFPFPLEKRIEVLRERAFLEFFGTCPLQLNFARFYFFSPSRHLVIFKRRKRFSRLCSLSAP